MAYLIAQFNKSEKRDMAQANQNSNATRPQNTTQHLRPIRRRKAGDTAIYRDTERDPVEVHYIGKIDQLVGDGRQKDLTMIFDTWSPVPTRMGDWELRVNVRRQDNVAVSRTIVAIPHTVRARKIFERGCLTTLKNAGYTDQEAASYYKAAWKKKYVWIESVYLATHEMIHAFQNTSVLDSYEKAGDPRRLAQSAGVPKNPYLTSHDHFLVAVNMAKCIILARQAASEEKTSESPQQDKPQTDTDMVMA